MSFEEKNSRYFLRSENRTEEAKAFFEKMQNVFHYAQQKVQ